MERIRRYVIECIFASLKWGGPQARSAATRRGTTRGDCLRFERLAQNHAAVVRVFPLRVFDETISA